MKRQLLSLGLLTGMLMVLLCSGAYGVQNRLPEIPENITVERDVVYDTRAGHDLTLDIAYPKVNLEAVPAIVHIHGGGWRNGNKSLRQALKYAKRGWVGLSIRYRLSGVACFPAGVHDCKTAIRWVRAHAKTYGIDPERIGVFGQSAGGHLVALLGTSGGDDYLEGDGPYSKYPSTVQAVVDHYGPTDFFRMNDQAGKIDHDAADSPESLWVGGPIAEHPDRGRRANPITYVDTQDPPILMIHGENDQLVVFNQSELLSQALKKANVTSELVRVKHADHGYRPNPRGSVISPTRAEIEEMEFAWFAKHLVRVLKESAPKRR
jgi:acetyl esterase/lipase